MNSLERKFLNQPDKSAEKAELSPPVEQSAFLPDAQQPILLDATFSRDGDWKSRLRNVLARAKNGRFITSNVDFINNAIVREENQPDFVRVCDEAVVTLDGLRDINCVDACAEFLVKLTSIKQAVLDAQEAGDIEIPPGVLSAVAGVYEQIESRLGEFDSMLAGDIVADNGELGELYGWREPGDERKIKLSIKAHLFEVLQNMYILGNEVQREKARLVIDRNRAVLEEGAAHAPSEYLKLLDLYVMDAQSVDIRELVKRFDTHDIGGHSIARVISDKNVGFRRGVAENDRIVSGRDIGKQLLRNYYDSFGVHVPDDVVSDWTMGTGEKVLGQSIAQNMNALRVIEELRPHAAQVLTEEFGIYNFGRYPTELLVQQYDERDRADLAYGVVIAARADYDGAFGSQDYHSTLEAMNGQLESKLRLRVIESGSAYGVVRSLARLNDRYAKTPAENQEVGSKISFAVLAGHGSPDSIRFGMSNFGALQKGDMHSAAGRRVYGEFFTPDATIVLFSCSTGEEKGIAQEISVVTGAEVVAPEQDAFGQKVNIKFDDRGIPVFDVKYGRATTKRYKNGIEVPVAA